MSKVKSVTNYLIPSALYRLNHPRRLNTCRALWFSEHVKITHVKTVSITQTSTLPLALNRHATILSLDTLHALIFTCTRTGKSIANQKISRGIEQAAWETTNKPASFRNTILHPVEVSGPCQRTLRHKDMITNIVLAIPVCPTVISLLLSCSFEAWETNQSVGGWQSFEQLDFGSVTGKP